MWIVERPSIYRAQRATALLIVLAMHVGLVTLLLRWPAAYERGPHEVREITLTFVDAAREVEPVGKPAAPPTPARRKPRPVQEPIAPPGAPPMSAQPGSAPAMIDWVQNAARAAERAVQGEEERRRQGLAMSPPEKPEDPLGPVAPEFGWSHAATHRVEPMEGGGTTIWISDRCALTIVLIPLPMCKLGKLPANGALFEHMNDPPRPGDWKD
jgi:hypothetical protein